MKILTIAAVVLLNMASVSFSQVSRQTNQVQMLYQECVEAERNIDFRNICYSYLFGFLEGYLTGVRGNVRICAGNANIIQLRQGFLNWAQANPAQWQIPQSDGLGIALMQAFPCR